MNLEELLIPSPRYFKRTPAENADCAESHKRRGFQSPHLEAESCGKDREPEEIRTIPHVPAEAETRAPRGFPHNPHNPHSSFAEIETPLPITLDYFRALGVELLPEDLAFLRWHLPRDTARRNAAIAQYVAVWCEAVDAEPMPHRKANQGRRAANTWLRQAME